MKKLEINLDHKSLLSFVGSTAKFQATQDFLLRMNRLDSSAEDRAERIKSLAKAGLKDQAEAEIKELNALSNIDKINQDLIFSLVRSGHEELAFKVCSDTQFYALARVIFGAYCNDDLQRYRRSTID